MCGAFNRWQGLDYKVIMKIASISQSNKRLQCHCSFECLLLLVASDLLHVPLCALTCQLCSKVCRFCFLIRLRLLFFVVVVLFSLDVFLLLQQPVLIYWFLICPPTYVSPSGKKFRSKPQLARYLGNQMDLSSFDFRTGKMLMSKLNKNRQRLRYDNNNQNKVRLNRWP